MPRKLTFMLQVHDSQLAPCGSHGPLRDAWIAGLPEGAMVEETLKQYRPPKTNPQLGYWFGVVIPHAVAVLIEAGHDTLYEITVGDLKVGVATTKDTVDLLFKTLFRERLRLAKQPWKRNMTTEQMSALIDFGLMWLVTTFGFVVPEPKPAPERSKSDE